MAEVLEPAAEVRQRQLAELVAERFGIELSSLSPSAVRSLLGRLPAEVPPEDDESLECIVSACSIGETMFLRHPEQFTALEEILPSLPALQSGGPLRVWSAGCASGEEAYSLAGVLRERLGEGFTVRATDLNQLAIARAREARYRPWSFRGVDPARVAGWLHYDELDATVRARVRAVVDLDVLNLVRDPYPESLDLVFCRNVLLYFHPEAARRVLARMAGSVRPGGALFLGYVDPVPDESTPWREEWVGGARFYRRVEASGPRGASPPAPVLAARPSSPPDAPQEGTPREAPGRSTGSVEEALAMARGFAAQRAFDEALHVLQRISLEEPLAVTPYVLTALVAEEGRRYELALAAARRSVFLAPREPVPLFLLGVCLRRADQPRLARARLGESLDALSPHGLDEPLPYGEGFTPNQLRRMIHVELAALSG